MYRDADFAADKEGRKSVSGGLVTVGGVPISWTRKKKGGVPLSTMEVVHGSVGHGDRATGRARIAGGVRRCTCGSNASESRQLSCTEAARG